MILLFRDLFNQKKAHWVTGKFLKVDGFSGVDQLFFLEEIGVDEEIVGQTSYLLLGCK